VQVIKSTNIYTCGRCGFSTAAGPNAKEAMSVGTSVLPGSHSGGCGRLMMGTLAISGISCVPLAVASS
jgi:hypothetical protein